MISDPDPGGPKTYRSYKSGSGNPKILSILRIRNTDERGPENCFTRGYRGYTGNGSGLTLVHITSAHPYQVLDNLHVICSTRTDTRGLARFFLY
jgi:hypothetical protein